MNQPHSQERAGLIAAGCAVAVSAIGAAIAVANGLAVVGWSPTALTVAILLGNFLIYRGRSGGERAAHLVAGCAFMMVLGTAGGLLSYLAFGAGAPLADPLLAAWDQALGFSWPKWAAFVATMPWLQRLLHFAYGSMGAQLLLALIVLPMSGMGWRLYELLAVLGIALVPTVIGCAVLPAEGAGVFFGRLDPAHYLEAQRALRAGALTEIRLGQLQGIVTFPSFHTITAIALINAARRTPLAVSAIILDGLMILSTPTEGWHYLVDAIGGGVVAIASILLAGVLLARLEPN